MFADKVESVVRPKKGRPHALRIIRDLVAFTPRGRPTNLAEALRYGAKLLRHHAIVVVLSDFRADGWEDALAQLAAANDVVAVTIDDPRELNLPDTGWVDLQDAETGQRVLIDTSHAPTRTRVRVAAERQLQERGRKLLAARLGAPAVLRSRAGWVVRYGVAVWTPGTHTLTLPPLWRVGPDGRSDSSAGGAASIVVASVIPDTLKAPDPRGPLGPLRLERRNPGPPLAAALVSIGLLAAGVAARRPPPRHLPPGPPVPLEREGPDARWLAPREPRAVSPRATLRVRPLL